MPGTFAGVSTGGTVTCAAPAAEAGYEVPVEMSVDNVSFTAAGHTFTYYHEVVVSASSPSTEWHAETKTRRVERTTEGARRS